MSRIPEMSEKLFPPGKRKQGDGTPADNLVLAERLEKIAALLQQQALANGGTTADPAFEAGAVLGVAAALRATAPLEEGAWNSDKPIPEDDAIAAAHPMKTGRYGVYVEAHRLVSAKHSKSALVNLVNWLLIQRQRAVPAGWVTIEAERVLYADRGRDVILCDRQHPGPVTLVAKGAAITPSAAPPAPAEAVSDPKAEYIEGYFTDRYERGDRPAHYRRSAPPADPDVVQGLIEALEPFAAALDEYDPINENDYTPGTFIAGSLTDYSLTLGDLRAARAALVAARARGVQHDQ